MAIDTSVENFSGAVLHALSACTPKCSLRDDPRPAIQTGIQNEIRLNNRLRRRWQVTRVPALKAEVNRLQRSVTRGLNEWRNDQWAATLEFLHYEDQSLWRMTKREFLLRLPLVTPGEIALSDSEKAEALADNLAPVNKPKLTNPEEVQEANRCV